MKRIFAILIVAVMLLSFSSCGNNTGPSTTICWSCGETIFDTAAFCSNCGSAVADNPNKTDSFSTSGAGTENTNNTVNTQRTTENTTSSDTTTATKPSATTPPTTTSPTTAPHTHNYSAATCITPATCSCGATKGDVAGHTWKAASCSTPKTCDTCGATEGNILEHNYIDGICTYCQKNGGKIKITMDNWDNYFEVCEWVDWNLNAFGEPTEFFGVRCSFNIKSEYADICSADISCEYLINQSHCEITYDVQNKTCRIVNKNDFFDEHLSTLTAGACENYISFSLGDMGKTTGTCTIAKYNFVKMTRIDGTITFY